MVSRLWFLAGPTAGDRLIVMLVVASNAILIFDVLKGMAGNAAFTQLGLLATFAELAFLGAARFTLDGDRSGAAACRRSAHQPSRIIALTVALLINRPAWRSKPRAVAWSIRPRTSSGRVDRIPRHRPPGRCDARARRESPRARIPGGSAPPPGALRWPDRVPNRRYFTDRLAADFANRSTERPLAVLLIDLDGFKAVNDSYGHVAGDNLLVAVGARLREAVRDTDMVARLGGDEFVISLPPAPTRSFRSMSPSGSWRPSSSRSTSMATWSPFEQVSASLWLAPTTRPPTTSSATPTSRCTSRRAAARAAWRPSIH